MKYSKVLFSFLFVFASIISFAQDPCNRYSMIRDSCNKVYVANRKEPDLEKRKVLYLQYQSLCKEAASSMGRCIKANNHAAGSKNSLINTYIYANALYNAGECDEANRMYTACLNNPYASTTERKNKITYATYISGLVNKCRTPLLATTGNTAYILEYSGKSGAFIGEIYKKLQDRGLLSSDPLTSEEQENIIGRTVYRSDSLNLKALAEKLSGQDDHVYRYPFLFLRDSASFLQKELIQEKNLNPKEDASAPVPDLTMYADFIFKRYAYMKENFFTAPDKDNRLISFYLVGGKYDSAGLGNYLQFSNKVHSRAQKQVAYYMALDNSVVAWTSSGGGTLIHEMIHAVINNDFANAPFWINEGLASLYEETNNEEDPLDNYRIIFIQQAYQLKKCFVPLTELFGADKYQFLSEEDYNLINACSRYFCKFIYDEFGIDRLRQIYQGLKQQGNAIAEAQYDLVCRITGLSRNELQSAWQDYLLNIQVPAKWIGILETELNKKIDPKSISVFSCSAIPPSQEAINTFEGHRNIDLRTIELIKYERTMEPGGFH